MEAIVQLQNIHYKRNNQAILNNISWTIEKNQHWALLGANGSGKTSLLKIITGYEWPSKGSVDVFGERYGNCNLRELRKRIGWVSTALEHRLPEKDTATEIVLSGIDASMGIFRDITEKDFQLARNALVMVNAAEFAERKFGILSQGEQQRILIARALVNQPGLLILDEPCAGLDPAAKVRFLEDLSLLSSRDDSPTMIFVTHHIEEIDTWIDNVMVLRKGDVLSSGLKDEILTTDLLSNAFDIKMFVQKVGQKYYIR